jgi:hypothetical protein
MSTDMFGLLGGKVLASFPEGATTGARAGSDPRSTVNAADLCVSTSAMAQLRASE